MSTSASDNARECEFAAESALPSPTVSRVGIEMSNASAVSSRSRPRLVKMRRHSGSRKGRTVSVSTKIDPGFNPFLSTSEGLNQVNNSCSVANEYSNSNGDINLGKIENVRSVSGASQSNSSKALSSEKAGSSEDVGNWGSEGRDDMKELRKFDRTGFVFGADRRDAAGHLNFDKRGFEGNVGNLGSASVDFVFGLNGSNSDPNLNSERRKFSESAGKASLNLEQGESYRTIEKPLTGNRGEMQIEVEVETEGHDNVGFVFGAARSDSVSNSKLGRQKPTRKVGKSISNRWGKMKTRIDVEICKHNDVNVLCDADQSDSFSNLNLEKGDCCEHTGSSVLDDRRKVKVESEMKFGKFKHCVVDCNSVGNESLKLKESCKSSVFTSGCRYEACSSFSESKETNLRDVMNTSSGGENFENFDGNARTQGPFSGLDANSVFCSSCNIDSGSGTNPVLGLSDEIKKLNIDSFVTFNSSNKSKNSNFSSCPKVDNISVFRNCSKSAGSSSGTSAIYDQMKNTKFKVPGSGDAIEDTSRANLESSNNNTCISECKENTFCCFNGGMENLKPNEMINELGNSNVAVNLGCSSGIFGMESQPLNYDVKRFEDPATCGTLPPSKFWAGEAKSSGMDLFPQGQAKCDTELNGAAEPSISSSILGFQPHDSVLEELSVGGVETKGGFSFACAPDQLGASFMNFRTPKWDDSVSFTANLFPGLNENLEFSAKSRSVKTRRLKKAREKLRQPTVAKQCFGQDFTAQESCQQKNPNSPGGYSPMDFSPYQETVTSDHCSRKTSSELNESSKLDNNSTPAAVHSTIPTGSKDDLIAATETFFVDKDYQKNRDPNKENYRYHCEKESVNCCPAEEFVIKAETAEHNLKTDPVCIGSNIGIASSVSWRLDNTCQGQFCFASSENLSEKKFTYSASSPGLGCFSAAKRQYRKKNRVKTGLDSNSTNHKTKVNFASSSVQFSPVASSVSVLDTAQGKKEDSSFPQNKGENKVEAVEVQGKKSATSSDTIQGACEKWRLRGNHAYKNGNFSKAENCYTKGVNCVPPSERTGSCLEPLVLCYSNRAAARMSLRRIREALGDCRMAFALDPNFHKVQVRAANGYLLLGEVDYAMQYFTKCMESGSNVCLDRRIMVEAFDGLQRAQKVDEYMKRSAELLQKRTSDAAFRALEIISEGLSISTYSEILLEMKAEALYMLRKYEEVIQLCAQTIDFAEKNFASGGTGDHFANAEISECKNNSFLGPWRLHLMAKSYFHLGKLEMALDLLENPGQAGSVINKFGNEKLESTPLAVTIRELLQHKKAGNEAFKSGMYTEAVEHYTVALLSNVKSRPFAAICFCNRAAAHQALCQYADAIADCSLAIALDKSYQKAISRRATLYEMIRYYSQAASDFQRLVFVLEKQSHGTPRPSVDEKVMKQTHSHLSAMEEEAKKGIPLDLYLILGVKPSDTVSEIKKAYRKAALRHHPDKAGQFLTRIESGDDGQLWKEIVEEVHRDADRLFKIIGEAYAVLSDPTKRSQYDLEEKIRNAPKESNGSSSSVRPSDVHNNVFGRSTNRRNWRGTYRAHGDTHSQW